MNDLIKDYQVILSAVGGLVGIAVIASRVTASFHKDIAKMRSELKDEISAEREKSDKKFYDMLKDIGAMHREKLDKIAQTNERVAKLEARD